MAQIELEATDTQVVERLALLLGQRVGGEYSTTAALALSTTIFAWVANRMRRRDDPVADSVRSVWDAELGAAAPWYLPEPLARLTVTEAIVRLRNASSHGDGGSVHPMNDDHCLRGFALEADRVPFDLQEEEMRRIGMTVAEQFVLRMRAAQEAQ